MQGQPHVHIRAARLMRDTYRTRGKAFAHCSFLQIKKRQEGQLHLFPHLSLTSTHSLALNSSCPFNISTKLSITFLNSSGSTKGVVSTGSFFFNLA